MPVSSTAVFRICMMCGWVGGGGGTRSVCLEKLVLMPYGFVPDIFSNSSKGKLSLLETAYFAAHDGKTSKHPPPPQGTLHCISKAHVPVYRVCREKGQEQNPPMLQLLWIQVQSHR